MKDREPTKILENGALRYGVYDDAGALLRYEYIKPEDEPTEEGTPLNKATLLSDATVEKVWPNPDNRPEDPTVNQALAKLTEPGAKIGDIQITSRNDLGAAWLKCNGSLIGKDDYPALFDALRTQKVPPDWTHVYPVGGNTFKVEYHDGLYVAATGTKNYYYTENPLSGWTEKTADFVIYDIKYGGGLWVGGTESTLQYSPIVTSEDPKAGWTRQRAKNFSPTGERIIIRGIEYSGEFWVSVGNQGGNTIVTPIASYATDPTGAWSDISANVGGNYDLFTIKYANGTWVIGGKANGGTNSNNALVLVFQDVTSIMTVFKKAWTYDSVISIAYYNGVWVCGLSKGSPYYYSSSSHGYLVSQDPMSNWETRTTSDVRPSDLYKSLGSVTELGGRFYILCAESKHTSLNDATSSRNSLYIYSSANPESEAPEWALECTITEIFEKYIYRTDTGNLSLCSNNDILTIGGYVSKAVSGPTITYTENYFSIASDYSQETKKLPNVEISDAVTAYIKALEE